MASENHIRLAYYLKEVHSNLRKSSAALGAEKAWKIHCGNKEVLETYAQCMASLATNHWDQNCHKEPTQATSRIKWTVDFCYDYFINKKYQFHAEKELLISKKININIDATETFSEPLNLIDVGSCFNPFKAYEFLNVLAIDLSPANETVFQCDFLSVSIGMDTVLENKQMVMLAEHSFEIVTFCFLLEYIPTSEQRVKACERAYYLLKPGGLLVINTPDSKHVGANSKFMKCWRYTMACMGFSRIKYEKFRHMHCMAFRKSLHKDIATRWALIHKEPYMEYAIHIPQDFTEKPIEETSPKIQYNSEDLQEMPFFQHFGDKFSKLV